MLPFYKVEGSECEFEARGDKSNDAKTGVQEDAEGAGDGKKDSTVGGEGTEMDFIVVYHEHRTPILSVLLEMLTMFPKYCVAFLVFSWKYENCSILPSLHSPCEALKAQLSPTWIVVHTTVKFEGVLIWCLNSQENGCLARTQKSRSEDTLSPSWSNHTAVVLWMNADLLLWEIST